MNRFCPECGSPLTAGARFCVECGTSLSAGQGSPAGVAADDQPTQAHPMATELRTQAHPMATELRTEPHSAVGSAPGRPEAGPTRPMSRSELIAEQFSAWPDEAVESSPWDPPSGAPVVDASGARIAGPQSYGVAAPPTGRPYGAAVPAPTAGVPAGHGASAGPTEPRRRGGRSWPILILVALALVVALIWAFAVLRTPTLSTGPAPGSTVKTSAAAPSGGSSPAPATGTTSVVSAQAAQANDAVRQTLAAGSGSRQTLVDGVRAYCDGDDSDGGSAKMVEALRGRMNQLAKLNELGDGPFKDLNGGLAARDQLKASLQAAADADQVYVKLATAGSVCGDSAELKAANAKASAAKTAFLGSWNPLMAAGGQPQLSEDQL